MTEDSQVSEFGRTSVGVGSTKAGGVGPWTFQPSASQRTVGNTWPSTTGSEWTQAIGCSTSPAGRVSPSSSPASAEPGARVSTRQSASSRWPGSNPDVD